MAFRYPYGYPVGVPRPTNRSRNLLDTDPDVYFNRLYINPRLEPVIWDMNDEVNNRLGTRSRDRGSRFQDSTPEFSPVPGMGMRGRQNRQVRDPGFASPQVRSVDEHSDQSVRSGIARERDGLPVNLAIKELYFQLEQAAKFYTNFVKEYEKDTALIKKYATREILESLWTRRVRRARDRDHDGYEDQFAVWRRKLCHALDGVIASGLDEANHDDRNRSHQSMARMVDKIGTANRQLFPLLDAAWRGQELCEDLIHELDLLKSLVKPERGNDEKPSNNEEHGGGEDRKPNEDGNWQGQQDAEYTKWG